MKKEIITREVRTEVKFKFFASPGFEERILNSLVLKSGLEINGRKAIEVREGEEELDYVAVYNFDVTPEKVEAKTREVQGELEKLAGLYSSLLILENAGMIKLKPHGFPKGPEPDKNRKKKGS